MSQRNHRVYAIRIASQHVRAFQPARRQAMRHAQLIKPPQPVALLVAQREMQILAQVTRRQLAAKCPTAAPRAPRSPPDAARPRSRAAARTAATSADIHVRPRNPHRKHKRQAGPIGTTARPRSQTSQKGLGAGAGARLPAPSLLAPRSQSPDRQSTAPHPHPSPPARSQSAAAPTRGRTPHSSASRICVSAALVREPSSSATRRTSLGGTRKCSFTLSTGPRQATHASETIRYPGVRKNSTDGISATSSRPAASESASRLGKSKRQPHFRRKRLQPVHQRLAVQIIDGADSHHGHSFYGFCLCRTSSPA